MEYKMSELNSTPTTHVFIDHDKYFKVDEQRRTLPHETFEGTLGFVIRVYSIMDPKTVFALKIPKLHGATHRENSYIIELMELEAFAALRVGKKAGLVGAESSAQLKKLLDTSGSSDEEAKQQNGGIYLVSYEPGKNPQFHLLLSNSESNTPVSDTNSQLIIDESEAVRGAKYSSSVFMQEITFANTSSAIKEHKDTQYFDQWKAAEIYSAKNTYYAFLPSVLYTWASGTLQDAITRQAKGKWDIHNHLDFVGIMTQAIFNLHVNGFIHADVRPANIMYLGDFADDTDIAPQRPSSYLLGDYGSFASASPSFLTEFTNLSGETKLARAFEGERISEFYAPERVSGTERETVDKALVFKPGENGLSNLWVVLGLKNQAIMKNKPEIITILEVLEKNRIGGNEEAENIENEDALANRLLRHDRIQIQNYIFELDEPEIHEHGLQILRCKQPPTQIVQKRIAIKINHQQIPDELAIDRIIELLQWAAAVDLYSVGVLTLYTIFMDQFQEKEDTSLNTIKIKNAEDKFRGMINILANKEYFITLWPQLEAFRHAFDNNQNEPTLSSRVFNNKQYDVSSEDEDVSTPDGNFRQGTSYKEFSIGLTMRVTAYVPGAKQLLEQLDNNVALFLLVLHFAVCCLHRKDHVVKKAQRDWMQEKEGETIMPFATHRTEAVENLAISKAQSRIEDLKKIVNKNSISGFILNETEIKKIPDFNPGNPGMILFDKVQLEEKIRELQGQFNKKGEEAHAELTKKVDDIRITVGHFNDISKYPYVEERIAEHNDSLKRFGGKGWGVSEDEKKLFVEIKNLLADYNNLNSVNSKKYSELLKQYEKDMEAFATQQHDFMKKMSEEIDVALKQYGQRDTP